MIKKLFLLPYFGKYPEWLDQWVANMERLKPMGYDYIIFSNLELFKQRVRDKLGIEPVIKYEESKIWDYRPMLGVLFEEEIKGYDFWGHTDFDVVYGDISKFEPDLTKLDIWSNHHDYICGFWTLYRNNEKIRNLFRKTPDWKEVLANPVATGWAERGYTRTVDLHHNMGDIERLYTFLQAKNQSIDKDINYKDGKLYDGDLEIMTFHFRRTKRYPLKYVL